MQGGIIYQVGADGTLTRMKPGQPANEDEIQRMIANHPEMVAGSDEPLLLVERECAISDKAEGSGRWSLDHLFVTRDARPVLVEVKQASNTQLRREVVGQLVEYAANAVVHWNRDSIRANFVACCGGDEEAASESLRNFLGEGSDQTGSSDPEQFWNRVEANLRAGELSMVIVADQIPRELVRIVEFMNEQMHASVQAVELRWYVADSGMKTLVPRIIGATERAASNKLSPQSRGPNEYWIRLKQEFPSLVRGAPWKDRAQNFYNLRSGEPTIVVGCRFVQNNLKLHSYFDYKQAKVAYEVVKRHQSEIDQSFGPGLEWDNMANYNAARIVLTLSDADMSNDKDWRRQHKWLNENGIRLGEVIRPYLPEIEAALSEAQV
ncbi:MAG: DUF4268 domain-containing protein [Pseudomonadota bacterium]